MHYQKQSGTRCHFEHGEESQTDSHAFARNYRGKVRDCFTEFTLNTFAEPALRESKVLSVNYVNVFTMTI